MQQNLPPILSYTAPHARRERQPIAAGFICGWLLGVPIGGVLIAFQLGGIGIVVPLICLGTAIAALPAFGLMWLTSRSGFIGNVGGFVVALSASVVVSFCLLGAFLYSFHGC